MLDAIVWVVSNILGGFANLFHALTNPSLWLDWSDKQAIMRFVYYGASSEFFFVILDLFILLTIAVVANRRFGWATVRVMEGFGNTLGRLFCWAGLIMVIQQIIIVFVQRVFARPDMIFGFASLVSFWSKMGLQPGDLIASGTPEGVALHHKPDPFAWYLKPGDVVEAWVSGIGTLRTRIV